MGPRTIENREEIILAALQMTRDGVGITELMKRIENEFNEVVSRSFLQKNLEIYENCRTVTEIKTLADERLSTKGTQKGKKNAAKPTKPNENVKQLTNGIFKYLIDNIDEIIDNCPMQLSVNGNGATTIDIREISNIMTETKELALGKLTGCLEAELKPKEVEEPAVENTPTPAANQTFVHEASPEDAIPQLEEAPEHPTVTVVPFDN